MLEFSGKHVVITGAAGVLGQAVVDRVLSLGGTVAALDIQFNNSDSFQVPSGLTRHHVDLTDRDATRAVFEKIGVVDALFNIAGGFVMGPLVYEFSDDDWDHMFDINVRTFLNCVRAAVPKMISGGRGGAIVNVGARAALTGEAHMGVYCAVKGIILHLTESLSKEVQSHGIRVNAVLPSIIDTPQNRRDMPETDFGTWVSPNDLSEIMCFLASNQAKSIHRALVPVSGLC